MFRKGNLFQIYKARSKAFPALLCSSPIKTKSTKPVRLTWYQNSASAAKKPYLSYSTAKKGCVTQHLLISPQALMAGGYIFWNLDIEERKPQCRKYTDTPGTT